MRLCARRSRGAFLAFVLLGMTLFIVGRAEIESSAAETMIYLVRHAEKQAAPPGDPPLSESGRTRAANLARFLNPLGIKTIITSQYLRTKETAGPLAEAVGATPIAVAMISEASAPGGIAEQSIKNLVDRILEHRGESILVVGHTNTLPQIIQRLGGGEIPGIPETEYDNLFVLKISEKNEVTLDRRKY